MAISEALRARLLALAESRASESRPPSKRELIDLTTTIGPAFYLDLNTAEVIVVDDFHGDGTEQLANDVEFRMTIIGAAEAFKIPELTELLPQRSAQSTDCSRCMGSGRIHNNLYFCGSCGGLGWV